jgi:VanZ family protein
VLTALYASTDEFHQTFVPGRHGSAVDVAIDSTGALIALLGMWWVGKRARET